MVRALTLGLLLLLGDAVSAFAQVTAYLVAGDDLYRVDLEIGLFEEVGPLTPSGGEVSAVAFDPSGTLLGYDHVGDRLLAIDTATAATTVLGSFDLGFEQGTGLAVDACGRIFLMTFHWFNGDGVYLLRTLAPESGEATLVGEIPYNVGPLAARGEELYGISPSIPTTGGDLVVVRIRPDTLEVTEVPTDLPPELATCGGLDFDAAGYLWTALVPPPIGIPPPPYPALRIDLISGEIEEFPGFYGISFAISPTAGACGGGEPPAIPAASPRALLILAVALGIAGAAALAGRRKRLV